MSECFPYAGNEVNEDMYKTVGQ